MISVRETACGTLQAALSHEPSVVGVAFSPLDENLFVSISSHTMTVWDLRPIGTMARAIRTVSGFPEGCSCVEFSPDGKMLAVGGSNDNITVWETDTWNRIATVAGKLGEIHSLRFSPDAKLIASGDIGGKLQVREIPSNPNALVGQSTYARGWASTRIF
ncbi:WD40-repeat-containing domain protein [Nemania sp. FL0916]|nr:WD40-repeat-containing domain protein [Nemania sp. FL0916]